MEELVDGLGDGPVVLALGEHQAVGDFEHAEGEGEHGAGDEVGEDQRQGDAADGEEWACAEVGGGFFEGDGGLLESGDGAADHVGEAADAVGDDEEEGGIGLDVEEGLEERALLDAGEVGKVGADGEVAEGHDDAGDGEGEHGEGVEEAAEAQGGANDDEGDGDAEEDVEEDGEAGEEEAVGDRGLSRAARQGWCVGSLERSCFLLRRLFASCDCGYWCL